MYSNLFSPQSIAELTAAMQTQFPKAIWETFYVTLLSTALAVVIGLQGFVIDLTHNYIGSFVVVLLAAAYIFYYALWGSKNVNTDIPVE